MENQKNKEFLQVSKILETMIEASEHFKTLIKSKEFHSSILMFNSIVQGYESIENYLNLNKIDVALDIRERLERNLLQIAKYLENQKLMKVLEVLQFSFMPNIRKLKSHFNLDLDNDDILIGVYYDKVNPRKVLPEARVQALVNEAINQNVNIIFFSSDDVNFEEKTIMGDTFNQGKWVKSKFPFPDVINNNLITTKQFQSRTERKLREEIPFTSFAIGDKFNLVEKLVDSRKYVNLLVPFKVATDKGTIYDYINEHVKVVLKPIRGARGENIYYVEKENNNYLIFDHTKKLELNEEKFVRFLSDIILKRKNSYMVQKYVNCRTILDEPFDIRAHMQKNGEGKWQITKIYPRIGHKKSILSNISRGGRTEDLHIFLEKEYGNQAKQIEAELKDLAMGITWHIDKLYGLALDELGLDLAIDTNGHFWLHEANSAPQTTYHEELRAVNTIAYAKYIAKNRIFHTNQFEQLVLPEDQFNTKYAKLEIADLKYNITVGMLVSEKEINELTVACAYVANYENVNFYYFTPKDIDFDEKLIRGYFYENYEWIPKVVPYPDVIYDRLRLRGIKGFNFVYEELDEIPITNEFYGDSIDKLEVYNKLKETKQLDDIMIPYKQVERVKDVEHFIHDFEKVILKPSKGSFARGVHFIEKLRTNEYKVAVNDSIELYNELNLKEYIRELIKSETYIVQKYIESRTIEGQPFDIRAHLMKDRTGNWSTAKIYPRIGINYTIIGASLGGYISKLQGFLKRNFPDNNTNEIIEKLESLSKSTAEIFEKLYDHEMNELGIDFVLDKEAKPYLTEINVNKPGIVNYEFEVAKYAIQFAKYLAMKNK